MQLTLQELEEVNKEIQTEACHEQEELENAKADCNEMRLRFESIDPQNTLVFRMYEKKLQEKMAEVKRLERRHAKALKIRGRELTVDVLRSLLALPQDIRIFWECVDVTNAERKKLLRCLIRQVTVKRRENSKYQAIIIQWVSGTITTLTITADGRRLDPGAVALMRELAPDHTITQIIDRLHKEGFKPTRGVEKFNPDSLHVTFKRYGIKIACPEKSNGGDKPRGDGRYSALAVAKMLNVNVSTVYRWCKNGTLDGISKVPHGTYWVKVSSEQVTRFRSHFRPDHKLLSQKEVN